ncbi:MAG: hypothetical protein LBR79_04255 [Oscillospiraceae bacterium]|nr:hypothetical protein [Oscillospiraceae bacterium]
MIEINIKYLTINMIFLAVWQFTIFLFSKNINISFFDPTKKIYSQKNWEHNGKFYTAVLRINMWKDYLPQHIGKNGFSKKNLNKYSGLSHEYINEFIYETCRAEWYHTICLFGYMLFLLMNLVFVYKLLFFAINIVINLPFILIQRYNRIRLNKLNMRYHNKFQNRAPNF